MCDYMQTIPSIGSTTCIELELGTFSLDPWQNITATCGSPVSNANQRSKLDFICNTEEFEFDTFIVVVFVFLSIGITCCCLSNIAFCKFRHASNTLDERDIQHDLTQPVDPATE